MSEKKQEGNKSITINENGVVLFVPTPRIPPTNGVNTYEAQSILQCRRESAREKEGQQQFDTALEVMSQVIKSGADLVRFGYRDGMEAIVIFDSIQSLTSFRSATETSGKAVERYATSVLMDMIDLANQDYDSAEKAMSKFIDMHAVTRNPQTKRCLNFAIDTLKCAEQLGGEVRHIVQPENEKKLRIVVSFKELEETQKFKEAVENLVKE